MVCVFIVKFNAISNKKSWNFIAAFCQNVKYKYNIQYERGNVNGSKKYKLSSIDKTARNQNYENELTWLDEAKIINLCNNVTEPSVGLGLSKDDNSYKICASH